MREQMKMKMDRVMNRRDKITGAWNPAPRENGGALKNELNRFVREEDGIGTVEVILILVVIVGLIVIFKNQLTTVVNNAFSTISDQAGGL